MWPLSFVDADDGDSLFTRDGVPVDHWTPRWDQEKMKYCGPTMESANTNPQGGSITRFSITLPVITKAFRAKLANKHRKLYLWLHYLLQCLKWTCPLVIISSLVVSAEAGGDSQMKLSVSNFTVIIQSYNNGEEGRSLLGDGEALVNLWIMSGVRVELCIREGILFGGERCTDCVAWRLIYILCRHSDKWNQSHPEQGAGGGRPSDTSKGSPMGGFSLKQGLHQPQPTYITLQTHAEKLLRPH